jgi:CheY-like chemotaxis protein
MTIEDPIVLLVDDSDNDALLMRTVFSRAGYVQPLRLAADGEEGIAYLRGDEDARNYKLFGRPAVVLLDLNMPRKNGFQVLEWIRQQPGLKRLCVCILSASSRPEDIARAYDLGASSYLVKPGNLDGLMQLATCLLAWIRLNHFAPAKLEEEIRATESPPRARAPTMASHPDASPGLALREPVHSPDTHETTSPRPSAHIPP